MIDRCIRRVGRGRCWSPCLPARRLCQTHSDLSSRLSQTPTLRRRRIAERDRKRRLRRIDGIPPPRDKERRRQQRAAAQRTYGARVRQTLEGRFALALFDELGPARATAVARRFADPQAACIYCGMPQWSITRGGAAGLWMPGPATWQGRLTIEHLMPAIRGQVWNLALACGWCNHERGWEPLSTALVKVLREAAVRRWTYLWPGRHLPWHILTSGCLRPARLKRLSWLSERHLAKSS